MPYVSDQSFWVYSTDGMRFAKCNFRPDPNLNLHPFLHTFDRELLLGPIAKRVLAPQDLGLEWSALAGMAETDGHPMRGGLRCPKPGFGVRAKAPDCEPLVARQIGVEGLAHRCV